MESEAPTSSVVVYAADDYLDLVKSARARDPHVPKPTRALRRHIAARRRTEANAAARQSRSAATYLRHQEALRALEEEQKRQHQIALQNQKTREQRKFSRLMSKCSDAISASHDLGDMLSQEDRLHREKCERQYKQWSERVFKPIQAQLAANLTDESFQKLHDLRHKMHEDYLRTCERPHGAFLQVPGAKPKDINMRYTSSRLRDPLKADLMKSAAESAVMGTATQFDRERQRYVMSPPEYLKVYPTERKHVRGPNPHKRILPNDYAELSCDPEVGHRELFPSSKRYYGAEFNPQLLAEPDEAQECRCCDCADTPDSAISE